MIERLRKYSVMLEAGLLGLFFVQALRFLIPQLYSRIASAALVNAYPEGSYDTSIAGIVDPSIVSTEIIILGGVIAFPLLTLFFGRMRFAPIIGAGLILFGRTMMTFPNLIGGITPLMGAEVAVAGGLMTICIWIAQRNTVVPYFFLLGFAFDQVIRAFGNTLDPTLFDASRYWVIPATGNREIDFFTILVVLVIITAILTIINVIYGRTAETERLQNGNTVNPNNGLLPFWGAVGMAGILFLQLSLLALPNAIMGRAGSELYQLFVTLTLVATLLPLIPEVRMQIRSLITPFEATTRGWIWLIFVALLIVLGTRISLLPITGSSLVPIGGFALVIAQLAVSMMWWWLSRPKTENQRNLGGLWMVVTVLIMGLLVAGDIFTHEYAFVRPFLIAGNVGLTETLNTTLLPLLRGFRGLGLGLILFAVLLSSLPMIQATRRIPWRGASWTTSALSLVFVAFISGLGYLAARPPIVTGVTNVDQLRIGTYNIHSGYSEFYGFTLDEIANDIASSGSSVVMLQEVEVGRLTSYGVDQSLWLARRLGMDERFYATNEGVFGLAVLSRVPIAFSDGVLLPSIDRQTGLQRVQIQPTSNASSVITLYNTQLGFLLQGPDGLAEYEQNQQNQLNTILGVIELHRTNDYGGQLGRTVLGGTFHNVDTAPIMADLRNYGFTDPFAGTNLALTATLNRSNLPEARFDFIWVWQQSLPQVGVNVVESNASDHRMAYVAFQIQSGN